VLVHVADEHPTIYAGVRALQASVVGLYGIVIVVMGVYPIRVHSP